MIRARLVGLLSLSARRLFAQGYDTIAIAERLRLKKPNGRLDEARACDLLLNQEPFSIEDEAR